MEGFISQGKEFGLFGKESSWISTLGIRDLDFERKSFSLKLGLGWE